MRPRAVLPVLAFGVVCLSWGAIFARLAAEADALVIAFWRCAIAAGVVGAVALPRLRRELAELPPRGRLAAVAAGISLALHFHAWIASLELTTISASCTLVATTPIWTALLTPWLSSDVLQGRTLAAIGVAFTGVVVIGGGDFGVDETALRGDLLAIAGALFAALYVLAGRRVRPHLSLASHLFVTYGTAALWLGASVAASGEPFAGYAPPTWWALAGLALVPQLGGHSILNWSLRWFSASFAAVATLSEPIFATLFAWILFEEVPDEATAIGGPILILGVVLAIRSEALKAGRRTT